MLIYTYEFLATLLKIILFRLIYSKVSHFCPPFVFTWNNCNLFISKETLLICTSSSVMYTLSVFVKRQSEIANSLKLDLANDRNSSLNLFFKNCQGDIFLIPSGGKGFQCSHFHKILKINNVLFLEYNHCIIMNILHLSISNVVSVCHSVHEVKTCRTFQINFSVTFQ